MTVRKIDKSEIPERRSSRRLGQRFGQDWQDFLAILSVGLKPHEAVEIKLTDNKMKYPSMSFKNAAKVHMKRLGLSYDVTVIGRDTVYVASR